MSEELRSNVDERNNGEVDDDPLAELARIVSGESESEHEDSVSRDHSTSNVTTFQRQNFKAHSRPEDDLELSLEAELARELVGDTADQQDEQPPAAGLAEGESLVDGNEDDAANSDDDFQGELIKELQDEISAGSADRAEADPVVSESIENKQPENGHTPETLDDESPVMFSETSDAGNPVEGINAHEDTPALSEDPVEQGSESAFAFGTAEAAVDEPPVIQASAADPAPGSAFDPEVDLGEAFAAEFEQIAAREAEKLQP